MVAKRTRQHHLKTTPLNRVAKTLHLLEHKVYSSVVLQFHIAGYQAILAKYDFLSYSKLAEFQASLSEDKRSPSLIRADW